MTCPHRVATEHGVVPAPHRSAGNPIEFIFNRQLSPGIQPVSLIDLAFLTVVLSSSISITIFPLWHLMGTLC